MSSFDDDDESDDLLYAAEAILAFELLLAFLDDDEGDENASIEEEPRYRGVINPGGFRAAIDRADGFLNGNTRAFREMFRLSQTEFVPLVRWLRRNTELSPTRYQSLEFKTMVFLYILGHGCTQRAAAHHFGITQSSVSKTVESFLEAFRVLHTKFVVQPDDNYLSPEATLNPKWNAFSGCIGAIDGTHVRAWVRKSDQRRWYNRKSVITQNVLCAVRLDGAFSYVLAGAEGSVNDATLIRHALSKSFRIPDHRFYIGDAGFGARQGLVIPYPGVRYHLDEWSRGPNAPVNQEELYNLRHARIRVIVEQIFGRVKRKFAILRKSPPEYHIKKQVLFVYAATGLWNFLLSLDPALTLEVGDEAYLAAVRDWANEALETSDSRELRKRIAAEQWEQYEDYHSELADLIQVIREVQARS